MELRQPATMVTMMRLPFRFSVVVCLVPFADLT